MKILFPLASFALSFVFQLGFASGEPDAEAKLIFLFWFAAYLPAVSFFYARKFLPGGLMQLSRTLVHSFLLALSFFLFHFSREGLLTALVIFVWCELWALLGLLRKQKSGKVPLQSARLSKLHVYFSNAKRLFFK